MSNLSLEEKKDLQKKAKKAKKTLRANRFWKFWHNKDKEAKNEAKQIIKEYKKSQNILLKTLRLARNFFLFIIIFYSVILIEYFINSFYLFSDTNKFLCHKQGDPIPAQYQYVEDKNLAEGEQKIIKEREAGVQRRCYAILAPSYMIREKEPVNGIIAYRKKEQRNDAIAQDIQSTLITHQISTHDGHCYEKRLPYKTNIIYKVGLFDNDYTSQGFDGWEYICNGKVISHMPPMDAIREITIKKRKRTNTLPINVSWNNKTERKRTRFRTKITADEKTYLFIKCD